MEYQEFMRRANAQLAQVWVKFKINGNDLLGTVIGLQRDATSSTPERWINVEVPGNGRYTVDILEQITHVGPHEDHAFCATHGDAT